MEKNNKNQKPVRRRTPGKVPVKKKAPHIKPRKNPPVQEQPVRATPEVVYLAPKPFSRNRFVLHLATVVAVVLALMLGLSIFFKVEKIEVSGCVQYTPYRVQQASGISVGDQLLTFSIPRAAGKITNALPYVKTVRIGIHLPDTVKIEIVETRVTYALQDQSGLWWLMDSAGKIVEQCPSGKEGEHTVIHGVTLENPAVGSQAKAYQASTTTTDPDGNVIPVTVTAAQRLTAVVEIAGYLEKWGIIGDVASMDVENLFDIQLWYGKKFHVLLGDSGDMAAKISCLKGFVDDYAVNRPYETGTLDISDPDWIEYASFGSDSQE